MSSSIDFDLSIGLYKTKEAETFKVEKKYTMRNALLQLIKLQESQVEIIKRDYEDELEDVQQNMDMLLSKISDHDEQVVHKIQQLYSNMQQYHHERKLILSTLTQEMGLNK